MTDRSEVINDATAEPPVPAPGGGASAGSPGSGRGGQPPRVPAQRSGGGGSRKGRTPGADGSIPVPPRAPGAKLVPAPPRVDIPPEHLEAIRSASAAGSPGARGSGPAGSRGAGSGSGRGPGGGKRGKPRKGAPVPSASAETAQIPAVATPERPDETPRPALVDDEADAPKRDKGKHAAETGIFPAITAEALAAEALAAAVALDAPPAGTPDPFTQPASGQPTGTTAAAFATTGFAPTGHPSDASTDEQPLVGAGDASTTELPAAIQVPGDDSPTVADFVPALAFVGEATDDDDDNHYRGARRRGTGGRRYPVGALVVIGVIAVIMGVLAVQLFSGNTRTPTEAYDASTGTPATPNLAVPPPDSPSAVDSPSVAASAARSHVATTTKAVVPVPVSHPASPAAPTSPPVTSRSGSLSMVTAANRCATVSRGGSLVLGGCGQTFTMPGDGTVQMRFQQMGTFCLDLSHGSTGNRTPVVLAPCNGSGTQKWAFGGNNALTNGQAGRCVDAEGGSTQNGTRLIIWDCSGNANQQWRLG